MKKTIFAFAAVALLLSCAKSRQADAPDMEAIRLVPVFPGAAVKASDAGFETGDIIGIYRKRWEIELMFKQLKQNFPLRYFYGESENAIKIQIWTTLIANLLLMVIQ